MLSGLFWMATLWAYAWYAKHPSAKKYVLVAVLFALGLMAKPMLVTLPFVLLLLDVWPLGRLRLPNANPDTAPGRPAQRPGSTGPILGCGRVVLEKVPLVALSAVSCLLTVYAQRTSGSVGGLELPPQLRHGVNIEPALHPNRRHISVEVRGDTEAHSKANPPRNWTIRNPRPIAN